MSIRPTLAIVASVDEDGDISLLTKVMDKPQNYTSQTEAAAAMLHYLRAISKYAAVETAKYGKMCGLSQQEIENFLMETPEIQDNK